MKNTQTTDIPSQLDCESWLAHSMLNAVINSCRGHTNKHLSKRQQAFHILSKHQLAFRILSKKGVQERWPAFASPLHWPNTTINMYTTRRRAQTCTQPDARLRHVHNPTQGSDMYTTRRRAQTCTKLDTGLREPHSVHVAPSTPPAEIHHKRLQNLRWQSGPPGRSTCGMCRCVKIIAQGVACMEKGMS
jgi:hypothetical protein